MAKKNKNKRNKKESRAQTAKKAYKGPFQHYPYEKIDAAKRVMELTNQTPTTEVVSNISKTDEPFIDEQELAKQSFDERKSPTERKKVFLRYGYYVLMTIIISGIITAIGLFFNYGIRINVNETEIKSTNEKIKTEIAPTLKEHENEIQNIKSNNRIIDYRLNQIERNDKNSVPNNGS